MTTDIEQQKNSREISNANLTNSFQPGESGNPAGRPKNSVTTLLKNASKKTTEAIAEKIREKAVEGDLGFTNLYLDRTDGPVRGKDDAQSSQDNSKNIYFILNGEQSKGLIEGISHRLGGADAVEEE